MADVTIGMPAPLFTLVNGDGVKYSLRQFRGKKVVLYFYPEDDTETCTLQACSFRDRYKDITDTRTVLIGVSPDGMESHQKFSTKYGLHFPILCDENKSVMKAYGVWKKKLMFGRSYMGVVRSTFIIDERGVIIKIFPRVRLKGHIENILKTLTE